MGPVCRYPAMSAIRALAGIIGTAAVDPVRDITRFVPKRQLLPEPAIQTWLRSVAPPLPIAVVRKVEDAA